MTAPTLQSERLALPAPGPAAVRRHPRPEAP